MLTLALLSSHVFETGLNRQHLSNMVLKKDTSAGLKMYKKLFSRWREISQYTRNFISMVVRTRLGCSSIRQQGSQLPVFTQLTSFSARVLEQHTQRRQEMNLTIYLTN